MYVVAMDEEKKFVPDGCDCIVTGIGALNIISALNGIDRNEEIHNIGYAGSNILSVGTKVRVGKIKLYHPNAGDVNEPEYKLDGDVLCLTSSDFVLATDISEPCVFDMELAYILAMGFTNVVAEKIVSDNLDIKKFYEVKNGKTEN